MQLIISGNPNLGTIRNVIYLAHQYYQKKIYRVLFIDNERSLKKDGKSIEGERNEMVRGYIENVTIESIRITKEALHEQIPKVLSEKLQTYGRSEIIVDLTNGDKLVSSALYASASLSQIEKLFFLFVSRDKFNELPENLKQDDYKIDVISPLKNLESIGRYTFFDIIYYRNKYFEIEQMFSGIDFQSSFLKNLFLVQIDTCISNYFLGKYPDSISAVGQLIEEISIQLPTLIKDKAKGQITVKSPKTSTIDESINWLRNNFCDPIRGKSNKNLLDYEEELKNLQSIDKLIDVIRTHRNISAHPYDFLRGKGEAKLILNTSLYVLEKIGESGLFKT